MCRDDDWQNTEAESFSFKKIRQSFARCTQLSAQDVDDWRPREHIAWMFNDGDEIMTSFALSTSCPTLKAIFTQGICQRLLEAKILRSKSPTTASDLLSLARLGGGHRPPFLSPRSTVMSQIS